MKIDASALTCFGECQKLYILKYILGVRRLVSPGEGLSSREVNLTFGTLLHSGLERVEELTGGEDRNIARLLEELEEQAIVGGLPRVAPYQTKTVDNLLGALSSYASWVQGQPHERRVWGEVYFELLGPGDVVFNGIIDQMVLSGKKIWFWDFKTSSRTPLAPEFWANSWQVRLYKLAGNAFFGKRFQGLGLKHWTFLTKSFRFETQTFPEFQFGPLGENNNTVELLGYAVEDLQKFHEELEQFDSPVEFFLTRSPKGSAYTCSLCSHHEPCFSLHSHEVLCGQWEFLPDQIWDPSKLEHKNTMEKILAEIGGE